MGLYTIQVNSTAIVQQAFARRLSGGRAAVVLFNRDDGPANASMAVELSELMELPTRARSTLEASYCN